MKTALRKSIRKKERQKKRLALTKLLKIIMERNM